MEIRGGIFYSFHEIHKYIMKLILVEYIMEDVMREELQNL